MTDMNKSMVETSKPEPITEAQVVNFMKTHVNAMKHHDVDAVLSQYDDRVLFWEACGYTLNGAESVRSWFKDRYKETTVNDINYQIKSMDVDNKLAYCAVLYRFDITTKKKGRMVKQLRASYILDKNNNGALKIVHVHGSESRN